MDGGTFWLGKPSPNGCRKVPPSCHAIKLRKKRKFVSCGLDYFLANFGKTRTQTSWSDFSAFVNVTGLFDFSRPKQRVPVEYELMREKNGRQRRTTRRWRKLGSAITMVILLMLEEITFSSQSEIKERGGKAHVGWLGQYSWINAEDRILWKTPGTRALNPSGSQKASMVQRKPARR